MSNIDSFKTLISEGYTFKGASITLGGAMLDKQGVPGSSVKIPLKTLNRHGLIAGATGTGKTKTLQVIAEQMSQNGIPTLLMDIKGDLSGIAAKGITNEHIEKRHLAIDLPWAEKLLPAELMTLTKGDGVYLKATVQEFGPVLLSKILELNDTQGSVLSLIFMFCKSKNLRIIDLHDLRKVMQYVIGDGAGEIEAEYGQVASATVNTIMRKVLELEEQGADAFFGEKSFEPQDLVRTDSNGNGIISIIRLMDIQSKPKLFSTFMIGLLNEVYNYFPEQGDADKPKLCIFIDEAHLIFSEASNALMDQLEVVIKLIRSKGIGIFFCTQNPIDIPDAILAQLGLKVQHALRAFTERDRKAIVKAAENYPPSEFYQTDELLTQLGIGEALVTALNEKGIPTPLAAVMCRAPETRMDVLSPDEVKTMISSSALVPKYNVTIPHTSVDDILKKNASADAPVLTEKEQAREEKEAEKEENRLEKERSREEASQKREEEREERERDKRNTKIWGSVTKAVTTGSGSRGGGILGMILRAILRLFGVK